MEQGTMSLLGMMRKVGTRTACALLCGTLAAGCATSRSEWTESGTQGEVERLEQEQGALSAPARTPFEPRAFVARNRTPAQCEAAARQLQQRSRDEAWAALRACVNGMRFTALRAVLKPAWTKDLMERPDAAALIARVVAYRGGSIEGDLEMLHKKRIPIFGLQAAMTQPDTYKGRYVLLRAQVGDLRKHRGEKPTVWLVEHTLNSVLTEQRVGVAHHEDSVTTWSGSVGGQADALGEGSVGGTVSRSEHDVYSTTVPNYDNVSQETGREALGRLNQPDPFLAPGRDFVILARFDGMRINASANAEDDAEAQRMPVLSIISYFEPHPLVVY